MFFYILGSLYCVLILFRYNIYIYTVLASLLRACEDTKFISCNILFSAQLYMTRKCVFIKLFSTEWFPLNRWGNLYLPIKNLRGNSLYFMNLMAQFRILRILHLFTFIKRLWRANLLFLKPILQIKESSFLIIAYI